MPTVATAKATCWRKNRVSAHKEGPARSRQTAARKTPRGAGGQPRGRTREEQADSRGTWRHARWRQEPRARQGRGAGTEGQEVTPAAASRPREQSGDRQTLTQFQETDSRKFRFALRGAVWVAGKQRSIFAATRHGALGHGALPSRQECERESEKLQQELCASLSNRKPGMEELCPEKQGPVSY